VGGWREETRSDLADADSRLSALAKGFSGEPSPDQLHSLWIAYVLVEKSVAFVKVELGVESPGQFVRMKAYQVPDERQSVSFSLDHLRRGARCLEEGDLKSSLRELRESRNYLRVLLREKRKARTRKASRERSARLLPRPSSSP